MTSFRRLLALLAAVALALSPLGTNSAFAFSRIKDLADVEGVRDNMLVGYGLVVGLNGTGDSLRNSPFTLQSVQSMLERLGVNTRGATLNTKNVAAVMVTANLPGFAAQGSKIDITVSALGDAKSLQGGTLLVTPLLAADGEIYAVAQGPIAVGGFKAEGAAASIERGVPTSGRIASGAIVEREVPFELASLQRMRLSLRNPDFTTAKRIEDAINRMLGGGAAIATNPATVELVLPGRGPGDVVTLLTDIEQLRVDPDQPAKIVIDEESGIIVMGAEVRVSKVAIAQGNLTIKITEAPQVSQPLPLAPEGAETVVVPRSDVTVDDSSDRKLTIVDESVSLQSLVDGLNALGIGPRDMISILQAIKAAGALQAEIEVM
jgi:flagellar P-ring protein precursor FlgI